MTTPETERALRQEIAELREHTEIGIAANRAALVLLVRYLAEQQQVYIGELCSDLDVLCQSNPDPLWQRHLMGLTEVLRGIEDGLPGGDR